MTAPLLQLQLLQALAELGLVGVEDLARLYSLRPSGRERSRGAAIRAEPAAPAAAGAAMRRMPPWIPGRMPARRIQGEGRLERQILRTILAAPDRAVDVPIDTLRADLPEAAALRALLEYLGSATGPGAAPGADAVAAPMLVEHFRDTPHAGPIGQAFADLLGVSLSPEDAGADLRGAVRQLELRRVAGDLEALYSREQEAGLSPEERVRMGDLLQQARRLKEQLREGA
jgi:hypothetical protein